MSIRLIKESFLAEQRDEFHCVRLLILLNSKTSTKPIAGLNKLAKLDFLLRYPNCLSRALEAIDYKKKIQIEDHEKHTIETSMIRFKYGPWDDRYRRWMSILYSKGLLYTFSKGNTVYIDITTEGKSVCEAIVSNKNFTIYNERSKIIMTKFNNYSGSSLLNFFYKTFPELEKMKWGVKIKI